MITTLIGVMNVISGKWKSHLASTRANKKCNDFVSILIPARNEEQTITKCLESALSQDYPSFEVVELNDQSTDKTGEILSQYSQTSDLLKVIEGKPLEKSWLGKNWACHQLTSVASGELFLFIDADVVLDRNALSSAVNIFHARSTDMMSIFPTQIVKTLGEKLLVNMVMGWINVFFVPWDLAPFATRFKHNKFILDHFTSACGQFILIGRDAYKSIGGHESIKDARFEDVEMARNILRSGHRLNVYHDWGIVSCRMYRGYKEALNGFSRGFFLLFKTNKLIYLLGVIVIAFTYLFPFIGVFFHWDFGILLVVIYVGRILESYVANENVFVNLVLHPIQLFAMLHLAFYSLYQEAFGGVRHKGRSL